MKHLRLAIGALLLATAAAGAVYDASKHPPVLAPPLAISTVRAFSEGGTVNVVVQDEVGQTVLIGLKGSLDVPPLAFPLVFQRWYGVVPLGRTVIPGSPDEAAILVSLRLWLDQLPQTAAYRDQLQHIEQVVGSRHRTTKTVELRKNAA